MHVPHMPVGANLGRQKQGSWKREVLEARSKGQGGTSGRGNALAAEVANDNIAVGEGEVHAREGDGAWEVQGGKDTKRRCQLYAEIRIKEKTNVRERAGVRYGSQ